MREYRFVHPTTLPHGRVVLQIRNDGRVVHRLIVVPLPRDFPPVKEVVKHPTGRAVDPQAGIPDQRPGVRSRLAVDLAPGRYGLFCLVRDDDNQIHVAKGMVSEFRVR